MIQLQNEVGINRHVVESSNWDRLMAGPRKWSNIYQVLLFVQYINADREIGTGEKAIRREDKRLADN